MTHIISKVFLCLSLSRKNKFNRLPISYQKGFTRGEARLRTSEHITFSGKSCGSCVKQLKRIPGGWLKCFFFFCSSYLQSESMTASHVWYKNVLFHCYARVAVYDTWWKSKIHSTLNLTSWFCKNRKKKKKGQQRKHFWE